MIQISIVVFREIFEIALIVGILMAATKNINGRAKWIVGGVVSGVFGSVAAAFVTDKISESFDGMGQEVFNGFILLAASVMIAWTVIWMQKHAKSLSGELKKIGSNIREGKKPPYALFVVVFLSVLREGIEIVLFIYSYYLSGTGIYNIVLGLLIGLTFGIVFGVGLYFGMLKTFGKYFFSVTSWILVFLAAGIVANAAGMWINAGILPALIDPIFDASGLLPQESMFGKFLHMFFGYIDRPAATQLIAYLFSVIGIAAGLLIAKKN